MSRNKTHVEYVTHKEYVNPKKGICVSVLTFRINLNKLPEYDNLLWEFEPFRKYVSSLDGYVVDFSDNSKEYVYWTVRGKATCNNRDKFDEELGKHIALTRAQKKAFEKAELFYRQIFCLIRDNLFAKYNELLLNCCEAANGEEQHANKLAGVFETMFADCDCVEECDGPLSEEGILAVPLKTKQV